MSTVSAARFFKEWGPNYERQPKDVAQSTVHVDGETATRDWGRESAKP